VGQELEEEVAGLARQREGWGRSLLHYACMAHSPARTYSLPLLPPANPTIAVLEAALGSEVAVGPENAAPVRVGEEASAAGELLRHLLPCYSPEALLLEDEYGMLVGAGGWMRFPEGARPWPS
jgi:hypothetical protein